MIQFQYKLSMILSLITIVGIIVTYDFDFTFAFHTPASSGATIIGGQVYSNDGNVTELAPLFVRPQNDTTTLANTQLQQPINGSSSNPNLTATQPINGSSSNPNLTATQPINGTQNSELNATKNKPEDIEEFVPAEEQRPQSSSSHRDSPQRTRGY